MTRAIRYEQSAASSPVSAPERTIAAALVDKTPAGNTDAFKDRLVKLIPSEIVAFYLVALGIASGANSWYVLAAFAFSLILTPVFLWRTTSDDKCKPQTKQYVLTILAFVIWALATSQPLACIGLLVPPAAAALLLAAFTIVAPLF